MGCYVDRKEGSEAEVKLPSMKSRVVTEEVSEKGRVNVGNCVTVRRLVGGFEEMYEVVETRDLETGEKLLTVVDKELNKKCTVRVVPKDIVRAQDTEIPALERELRLLPTLDHPNVLMIYDFLEDDLSFYLVTEHYLYGEFERYITGRQRMPEHLAGKVLSQLFSALNYSHQLGISQRRLNLNSICLQTEADDVNLHVKVSFGEGHLTEEREEREKMYMAPEALKGKYLERSDIWSCGVILYHLLSGEVPFPGKTSSEIITKMQKTGLSFNSPIWRKISQDGISFISLLLNQIVSSRPMAQECMGEKWAKRHAGRKKLRSRTVWRVLERLKGAQVPTGLKRAIEMFMVVRMADREALSIISEAFRSLDHDGDGSIGFAELHRGYRKHMNASKARETAQTVFQTLDYNNSGTITFSEFLLAAVNTHKLLSYENIRRAFDTLDKDKTGQVTTEELKELLMTENPDSHAELMKQMFDLVDTSGDGEIDYEEFEQMMTKVLEVQ